MMNTQKASAQKLEKQQSGRIGRHASRFLLSSLTAIVTFFASMASVNAGFQKLEYSVVITPDHFPIVFPKRNADGDPVDYGQPTQVSAAELLNTDICYSSPNCSDAARAAGAVYYKIVKIGNEDIIFYYDELGNLIGTQKVSEVKGFDSTLLSNSNSNQYNPVQNTSRAVQAAAIEKAFPTDHRRFLVGSTNASFEVSPSGAANYSIPVFTPPAINGMQPEISINYSSQGGNGLLGVGFSLGGLSTITRCPTTKAQDWPEDTNRPELSKAVNFTPSDAFCLDGQRLILVEGNHGQNGAEYRTEIESFSRIKITASDSYGPTAFTMETKSGQKFIYDKNIKLVGHVEDSAKDNKTTFVWPVRQIKDVSGQSIDFDYEQDDDGTTHYRPKTITYGATGAKVNISFIYQKRPNDSSISYSNGYKFSNTKRLFWVMVQSGETGSIARRYVLTYDDTSTTSRSRISKIAECKYRYCLPPVTFDWTNGPNGLVARNNVGVGLLKGWQKATNRLHPYDYDGDGYTDIVVSPSEAEPPKTVPGGIFRLIKGGESLSQSEIARGLYAGWGARAETQRMRSMDVDGDGTQEFVVGPHHKSGNWMVYRRGDDGKFAGKTLAYNKFKSWADPTSTRKIHPIDLNGDGRQDLLLGPERKTGNWHALISKGDSFEAKVNYISGSSYGGKALFYPYSGSRLGIWADLDQFLDHFHLVDADGDGLQDIMIGPNQSGNWLLLKSTGKGFTPDPNYIEGTLTSSLKRIHYQRGENDYWDWIYAIRRNFNAKNTRFLDVNGDGLQDLVMGPRYGKIAEPKQNRGDWYVYLNTGAGFKKGALWKDNAYATWDQTSYQIRPMDIDLDGKTDLVFGPSRDHDHKDGGGKWYWLRSTGSGFEDKGVILDAYSDYTLKSDRIHSGDYNGDGLADLLLSPNNSGGNWHRVEPNGGHPDQLVGIKNGPSPKTTINYELLTRGGSDLYTEGKDPVAAGQKKITMPMMVVQSVSKGDGIGGTNTSSYKYEDLRIDLKGRGMQGFGKVIVTDTNSKTSVINEVETHYGYKFPFTGLETYVEKRVNGSKVESAVKYYVSKRSYPDDSSINVHYPVNYENVASTYRLDDKTANDSKQYIKKTTVKTGAFSVTLTSDGTTVVTNSSACNTPGYACRAAAKTTTTYNFDFDHLDEFGNIKWMETVTTDASGNTWTKLTKSTYENIVSDSQWHLGRLKTAEVTHSASDRSGSATTPSITRKSTFTYDSNGQLLTETVEPDATDKTLTKVTTYGYDSYGLKNSVTETGYDKGGNKITRKVTTKTDIDSEGGVPVLKTTVTNSKGESEITWTSLMHGGVLRHQGPNKKVSTAEFDSLGRKTRETNSLGVITETWYHWAYNGPLHSLYSIKKQTVGLEDQATVYYDKLNREIKTTTRSLDGRDVVKETFYDHRGLVKTANRPYLAGTTPVWLCFEYDALGRVIKQDAPASNGGSTTCGNAGRAHTTTVYNGLVTTVTDPLRHQKRETRNAMDKVVRVDEALESSTDHGWLTYTYDAVDNLRTVTDALGRVTTLNYDNNGRKTSMVDPTMGTWKYEYNSFDELTWQKDAKGQVVTMKYDVLGRMIQRKDGEGEWRWAYGTTNSDTTGEKIGKLKQVSGPNRYLKTIRYNSKLQIESTSETQTLPNGSSETLKQSFSYDGWGRVAKQILPGNFELEHEYNRYGHLVAVKSPKTKISEEAKAKLEAAKADAEAKLAAAEAKANGYLNQAYSYQQKAKEYELYAMAILRKEAYKSKKDGEQAAKAAEYVLPGNYSALVGCASAGSSWSRQCKVRVDQIKSAKAQAEAKQAKILSDAQAKALPFYKAANDLRDISSALIDRAEKDRKSAKILADAAIAEADIDTASKHRFHAQWYAQKASDKLSQAKAIAKQVRESSVSNAQTDLQLKYAEDMLSGAQASYRSFQGQIALAERYERYAAGIGKDLDESGATTWWRAAAADAEGRITKSIYGNGTATERVYDPNTGQLNRIMTTDGVKVLQDLVYSYDNLNNVKSRQDVVQGYSETYRYDALDRLKAATLKVGNTSATRDYAYNQVGDIQMLGATKLVYDEAAKGTGRLKKIDGKDYSDGYDANGNMTKLSGDRVIAYTSFNKPSVLSKGTKSSKFIYNANRGRMLKVNSDSSGVIKTTRYFGGYEKIVDKDKNVEHRYHISVGGALIAVHSKTVTNPAGESNYLHKDALGSTDLITSDTAGEVERLGYTPFGTRRDMGKLREFKEFISLSISGLHEPAITKRGFTGHEHIDELDLIHMNGRVYDPSIGRFLSPDPHVQMPKSVMGFNRYAYVQNNPLKYTDPSGYFLKKLMRKVGEFVSKYKGQIISIVLTIALGPAGNMASAFLNGMVSGFVGGFVASGGDFRAAMKGAVLGGLSAAMAYGIGHGGTDAAGKLDGSALIEDHFARGIAHGASQGVVSEMRGGRFKDGFLSGSVGHWAGVGAGKIKGLDVTGRTVVAAMAGGITSAAGGGKFGNGAVTAAFVHLFNYEGMMIKKHLRAAEVKVLQKLGEFYLKASALVGSIALGGGAAGQAVNWSRTIATPMKLGAGGSLQPFSLSTGKYLSQSAIYTNGQALIYRSLPVTERVFEFSMSTLPGAPALSVTGLLGWGASNVFTPPHEYLRK